MIVRTDERTQNRIAVRYGLEGAEKLGFTRNVSAGGLCLKTHNVFKIGTRVQVSLSLAERPVKMQARVVWSKAVPRSISFAADSGMGLAIEDPPNEWIGYCRTLR